MMASLQTLSQGNGACHEVYGAPHSSSAAPKSSLVTLGPPQDLGSRLLLTVGQPYHRTTASHNIPRAKILNFTHNCSKTSFVTRAMIDEGGTSSRFISSSDDVNRTTLKLWENTPRAVRNFPWMKAYYRLIHRLKLLLWTIVKWVAVPALIISALSEIMYSVSVNKALLVPVGLLAGIIIAGVLKETAIELSKELQDGEFPWHLVGIGVFFTMIKLSGPYLPVWAAVFLLHLSTGGLLQIIHFIIEWWKNVFEKPQIQ